MSKFDRNQYRTLTIPAHIYNDKRVRGIQKMILTIMEKFDGKGNELLDKEWAYHILDEKHIVILDAVNELKKNGYIRVYASAFSKSGRKYELLAKQRPLPRTASGPVGDQLF